MNEKNKTHSIRLFLIGGIMGIANIIPGVSGGTIAVVFSIYDELMEALGNFITDKMNRWKHIRFLILIFSGSLTAILIFSKLLKWSLENYPLMTIYLFIGLIIGSIPVILNTMEKKKIEPAQIISFIFGLALVVVLSLMNSESSGFETVTFGGMSLSAMDLFYYFICGAIAASAMIIPGVSGSFILILLGAYAAVLSAVSGLSSLALTMELTPELLNRVMILGSLGIGVVVGILGFAKIMSWALKHHFTNTMFIILGLIVGSIYQIFPGFEFNLNGAGAVLTLVGGFFISLKFGKE
jgi:putative membrane protein